MATKKTTKKPAPKTKKTALAELPAPLAKMLKKLESGSQTAKMLAGKLKIGKPAVYAQLRRLEAHGYKFKVEKVRHGAFGPEAAEYTLK